MPEGVAELRLQMSSLQANLTELRAAEGCHFMLAARVLGKIFQSDDDETLCDGAQLAPEIAEGLVDTVWPELFMHTTAGSDTEPELSARGGPRISELRGRAAYFDARTSSDAPAVKYVIRILPTIMQTCKPIPCHLQSRIC